MEVGENGFQVHANSVGAVRICGRNVSQHCMHRFIDSPDAAASRLRILFIAAPGRSCPQQLRSNNRIQVLERPGDCNPQGRRLMGTVAVRTPTSERPRVRSSDSTMRREIPPLVGRHSRAGSHRGKTSTRSCILEPEGSGCPSSRPVKLLNERSRGRSGSTPFHMRRALFGCRWQSRHLHEPSGPVRDRPTTHQPGGMGRGSAAETKGLVDQRRPSAIRCGILPMNEAIESVLDLAAYTQPMRTSTDRATLRAHPLAG